MEPKTIHLKFTTAHYKFNLTHTEKMDKHHTIMFLVGDENKPCLEGVITLENISGNTRYDSIVNTASLINIKALQECSLDDITDEYMEKYSFGIELLNSIVFFINSQYPMIKTVKFNDSSFIPCIRDSEDTLDLLTYSIALYKKTWYEEKMGAYMVPKQRHDKYLTQVKNYASKEKKASTDFTDIYNYIKSHPSSRFAKELLDEKRDEFEEIFNKSETLPEFFINLSRKIERKKKCQFFKGWLEMYINSQIRIERAWYFDLFPKIQVIEGIEGIESIESIQKKRMTRKRRV